VPVRLGPPFSAAAAGEPAISMVYRPTITSVTSEDRRSQVRSARLHNRAKRPSAHAADRVISEPGLGAVRKRRQTAARHQAAPLCMTAVHVPIVYDAWGAESAESPVTRSTGAADG
jgi:hypothetical protein